MMGPGTRLVLASTSPRRRQILRQLGLPFTVAAPAVDEEAITAPTAAELVRRRALAKAESVAAGRRAAGLVLGVDTVVALGERVYGKPADPAAAVATLLELAGRCHEVWSAIALVGGGRRWLEAVCTRVRLRGLTRAEVEAYVATGEPLDKAGAYAAQGRGAALVEGVEGCFWNVVGLPVAALVRGLRAFGVEVLDPRPPG